MQCKYDESLETCDGVSKYDCARRIDIVRVFLWMGDRLEGLQGLTRRVDADNMGGLTA